MAKNTAQGTGTAAAKSPADAAQPSQPSMAVDGAKGNGTYQPSQVRKPFTVVMYLDRVTKNALRYQEEHSNETEPDRIGQLYMQKHNFPDGAPKRIVVTIGRIEG